MTNLLAELRHIATTADEDTLLAQALLDPKIAARIKEEQDKALPIVEGLVEKAKLAAAKKERRLVVMKLSYGSRDGWSDISRTPDTKKPLTRADLGVKAKAVFDYCTKELGLPTKINYNYDGGEGRNDSYDMTINWDEPAPQPRY